MFQLKTLDVQDNSKLMIYLAIAAIITANIFIGVLALVFKDGIATEAASLYQQEITISLPTAGVVTVLQHSISTFFASKQIASVSRETNPPA